MNFLLLNAIFTFYNLYYDYLDLITKFCPGFTKWNTPFKKRIGAFYSSTNYPYFIILMNECIELIKIKRSGYQII